MATTTQPDALDVGEPGRDMAGKAIRLNRRLYMQFLAFGDCGDEAPLIQALRESGHCTVLYRDLHDPSGVGLLALHESPDFFVQPLRDLLRAAPFSALRLKPAFTMFGRTYSLGYETDLEHVLLHRPRERVQNPAWPWHVWYPLRRTGSFARLEPKRQREMLMEHGRLGNEFGEANLARDIRLACHGLDTHDNDFVIGLIGAELHPLSALVQAMRATQQTSEYLASLGPFFVGRVQWQSHPQGQDAAEDSSASSS